MADLLGPDGAVVAFLTPLVLGGLAALVVYVVLNVVGKRLLDDPAEAAGLARTAFVGILSVGLLLALGRLVDREATDAGLRSALAGIVGALPGLTISFILLIAALLVAAVLRATVARIVGAIRPSVAGAAGAFIYWTIVVLAVLIAAEQAGIDVAVLRQILLILITGLVAAVALGIGLGLRPLLASIFAGRHVDQVVSVGDDVTVGEVSGTVVAIGHASITLKTGEASTADVPHGVFLDSVTTRSEPDSG